MEWKTLNWELRAIRFYPHSVPFWKCRYRCQFLWMADRMEWVDKNEWMQMNHLIKVLKYSSNSSFRYMDSTTLRKDSGVCIFNKDFGWSCCRRLWDHTLTINGLGHTLFSEILREKLEKSMDNRGCSGKILKLPSQTNSLESKNKQLVLSPG